MSKDKDVIRLFDGTGLGSNQRVVSDRAVEAAVFPSNHLIRLSIYAAPRKKDRGIKVSLVQFNY